MNNSPQCANCFQDIPWTPVLENGEVYCCDGCVMGGPCVCTYDGPPIKLDTRGILESAGYDLEALAAELSVCANCFEEFTREPALAKDTAYCCQGCVRGGPCTCTYGDKSEESTAPSREYEVGEPFFADIDGEEMPVARVEEDVSGLLNANSLWQQISQWDDTLPGDEAASEDEDEKANDRWLLRHEITAPEEPEEDEGLEIDGPVYIPRIQPEVEMDADLDIDSVPPSAARRKKFRVVASPLDEVTDVRSFTSALDSTPSVESAILTHYSGDAATFEIEARNLDRVIRELVEGDDYPIRSFSMTPEGLELTLRSRSGDLLADVRQPEQDSHAQDGDAVSPSSSVGNSGLRPFKFEMGVDIFFNGRHQVEVSGISGPVHMHSWRIQATLAGESVDESGSLIGTQQVKDVITDYVSRFNENMLNKVPPFDEIMPTSNNIARVIFDHVSREMEGSNPSGGAPLLKSIRLWESPTSYVEYSGDARAA